MSAEENKAIVRRYIEQVWNKGELDLFKEFYGEDVVPHVPSNPLVADAESLKRGIAMVRNAFPDIHITVEDEIAEGEKVVQRWTWSGTHQGEFMGVPASGKQVTLSGMSIFRLAGARIVEFWTESDNMSLMQQLGVIPAPAAG